MLPRTTRLFPVLILVVAPALIAGCSKASPNASNSGSRSTSASTSSATGSSSSASASVPVVPTPTQTTKPTLGGTCDSLLPVSIVEEAMKRPVVGTTAFIVGVAEPNIGRLARLNCRYGLVKPAKGKPAAPAKVEVGVSLYTTADQAAQRVSATVEDYRNHGASQSVTTVGQYQATILTGYGLPTLVVAAGPRTVAVTVDPKLVGATLTTALTAGAQAAIDATSHFSQGGPVTPAPTTTTTTS